MVHAYTIRGYIETLSGHPLHPDEGIRHGDGGRTVSSVTVAWMATPDAILAARRNGSDLMIVHESLYFPYNAPDTDRLPADWSDWPTNRQRRESLDAAGLTLMRIHGSADEICILDVFAGELGLGAPVLTDGYVKVYEIPPCPFRVLAERVKARLGMAHVRIADAGRPDLPVSRVGLPWGGMGLFVNVEYQQRLMEQGCDVLIAGESDNYGFRFAAECGIPMIETSHEVSENPGLRQFTDLLAERFPEIRFTFHENPCIWRMG